MEANDRQGVVQPDPQMNMDEPEQARSMNMFLWDSTFAAMMASLAGGIFLVGFALNVLQANALQIGILAALPMSANVAQIIGSVLLETLGHRRVLCIVSVTLGRLIWIPILFLPLALFDGWADLKVWLLVVLVALSSLLNAISRVAWLEWLSDLVPAVTRGAWLARRAMFSALGGVFVILGGGAFLSFWENLYGKSNPYGYIALFSLGIFFGVLASWFMYRAKDPRDLKVESVRTQFKWQSLGLPFRDHNFLVLVVYAGAFMFVTQMAGPFYSVYMMEVLEVDLGTITWFLTFAAIASLFMLRIWGPISDTLGNRPVLIVAGTMHALIPLVWVVAQRDLYFWPLVVAHVLSGGIYAAITLAQLNILIKLAPEKGKSIYLAMFNAAVGVCVAVAPIAGGVILGAIEGFSWQIGGWQIGAIQLLFLISGVLQLVVLLPVAKVQESDAAAPKAVVLQLRAQLDPQTRMIGAADMMALGATRSSGLFRKLDAKSDEWATACEGKVCQWLGRAAKPAQPYFKRCRKWIEEEN